MNEAEIPRIDELVRLLEEIRDDQRSWIERSDRATAESQRVQAESVRLQASMGQLYKRVLLVTAIVVVVVGVSLGCAVALGIL